MGMVGFIAWFTAALIITMFLELTINNPFITSFIVAAVVGFLGAREM